MKVQVERVLYDSPDTGFHICKAAVLEATQEDMIPKPLLGSLETLTIKGYFPVNKIVNLLVKGSWEKSKYGYALVVNVRHQGVDGEENRRSVRASNA